MQPRLRRSGCRADSESQGDPPICHPASALDARRSLAIAAAGSEPPPALLCQRACPNSAESELRAVLPVTSSLRPLPAQAKHANTRASTRMTKGQKVEKFASQLTRGHTHAA
mmetsp:Transcript_155813/g.298917  ORF Transcript_155813/g.298917 Transcript_155813/m.298917 type:complete len:112 (+) Transcript_155813:75-410(+)